MDSDVQTHARVILVAKMLKSENDSLLGHHDIVQYLNFLQLSVCIYYRGNISSLFSGSSEAFASEFQENNEEIFSHYYSHC